MKLGVALYLSALTVNAQAPSSALSRKAQVSALLKRMTHAREAWPIESILGWPTNGSWAHSRFA